jgi:hypothetical protein
MQYLSESGLLAAVVHIGPGATVVIGVTLGPAWRSEC